MSYFDDDVCPVCRTYSESGKVCDDCLEGAEECPVCGQLELNGTVCEDCLAAEDEVQEGYDRAHEVSESSRYLASLI